MNFDSTPTGPDIGSVHDALTEVEEWRQRKFTDEEIQRICAILPRDIHALAVQWTWGDTEVRDDVFVWARKHTAEINKLLEAK